MNRLLLKLSLLVMAMVFSCLTLFAQTDRTVTGTVKDESGTPMPAVSVSVKGTQKATSTNAEGKYSLSVHEGNVLLFRYLGYKPHEVTIGATNVYNVNLVPSSNSLEEVQITGALGIQKEARSLGYAVTNVKGDDLARTNTVNPIAALQGKVAGVNINLTGVSGIQSSPSIVIRGAKSLTGKNQPIFVIDGIVLENNLSNEDYASIDGGSQLKNLNPDNYESVTVLKGAAATALYGARGANGAIVIVSKKGSVRQGLGIEYSSTYSKSDVYNFGIPLQNKYGNGSFANREGSFKPDGTTDKTSYSFGPLMDGSMHPAIWDATTMVPFSAQPDNWKAFYNNATYANNNLALSGGSEKSSYRASYSNSHDSGFLPNNTFNRNAFDVRYNSQLNNVFSTELSINYAVTDWRNGSRKGANAWDGGTNLGFATFYALPRNADLATWHNNYRNVNGSQKDSGYALWNQGVQQIFRRMDLNDERNNEKMLITSAKVKAQVTPWFDLNAVATYSKYNTFYEDKEKGDGAYSAGGWYALNGSNNSLYNYLFTAHVAKKALNDNLNVDFRLLNEIYGNGRSESYRKSVNGGLNVPNFFALSNTKNALTTGNVDYSNTPANQKTVGIGGVLNLNWKNYLNLELTGRNDWVSTLAYPTFEADGANNISLFYPSANLSWVFSDTWKDKMPSWLNYGQLRASLAYVGRGTDPYSTSFRSYSQTTIFDYNGASVVGANRDNASVLPNYNLRPEKQRSIELGTNLSFLKDLVSLDFAWYKTNTFNQILKIAGVPETGTTERFINAGNIQNQGIEFLLTFKPIKTKEFNWDFSFNGSKNRGKVVKFYPGIDKYKMGDYNYASVWAYEGGDFGVLSAEAGYQGARAIDPATGLPIIVTAGRSTSTDPTTKRDFALYDWQYSDKRQSIGKVEPDFVGGFNTNFRWKNLSLYSQIDGRVGGYVYSESFNTGMQRGNALASLQYRDQENGGIARTNSYNGQTVYDGYIPDAVFAQGQTGKGGANIGGMTFRQAYDQGLVEAWRAPAYYVYSYGWGTNIAGSASKNTWVMLREITLSYELPLSIISKVKLKGARIGVSARNIGYLYNGLKGGENPESTDSNNPFHPFIGGAVPFVRNYSATLKISL